MTNPKRGPRAPTEGRVHIVLIPGFGGFDALGQLEYYAGVTPQFQRWKESGNGHRQRAVLHYFDNFPTAAVQTRAALLGEYLAKRVARGEFIPGDSLALVGHSTGGLDIRKLLWEWHEKPKLLYSVDGATRSRSPLLAETIRAMVKRVVFLSVPQLGTNIADWVRAHKPVREFVITELRASVAASQAPLLDKLESWLSDRFASAARVNLLYALEDALNEAESDPGEDSMAVALAQDAASQLELWLRHMAWDFKAIDDLTAAAQNEDHVSPAHFGKARREKERASWKGIRTQSYATLGPRLFGFQPGRPAPTWDLLNPSTYSEFGALEPRNVRTDIVYRCCYRACAGGPFHNPNGGKPHVPKQFVGAPAEPPIQLWDNDGIVNTASMLWPDGRQTLLVRADHMDIVGHYQRVGTSHKSSKRKYDAYDLLKSASGFDDAAFAQVRNHVFDFCTEELAGPAAVRHRQSPAPRRII